MTMQGKLAKILIWAIGGILVVAGAAGRQAAPSKVKPEMAASKAEMHKVAGREEPREAKIKRAVSAAPADIAKEAKAFYMEADGSLTQLREGKNDFTCVVGARGKVGQDAMCADGAAMQWIGDWMGHKAKPTNTKPGIVYMLTGGTDWSATDPWATKGTPIKEPPHWMILWPFEEKEGLSGKLKMSGTWIMWAGTPYAHLMINQKP